MCNAWQFNHSPNAHGGGCEGAVAALAEDGQPPPFGPHGGCEGEQYRGYTCQLFSVRARRCCTRLMYLPPRIRVDHAAMSALACACVSVQGLVKAV